MILYEQGGLFTFGGAGTALYGLKVTLEKAIPGSMVHGVREDVVIFFSDASHLSRPQEQMPYLYQFGKHRPGMYSLETSGSGTGVLGALGNMKLFGKKLLHVIIRHIIEMAQLLAEHLEGHACTTVLNRDIFGPVTLFRVYPDGVYLSDKRS